MDEIKKDKQKPKICRFALVAFLIPTLYFIGSCYATYGKCPSSIPDILAMIAVLFLYFVALSSLFVSPVSFILGFIAIIKIIRSKRLLKGYTLSILGILMSVWAFDAGEKALTRFYVTEHFCGCHMIGLKCKIQEYSKSHDGQYPEPNQWCDLLFEVWNPKTPLEIKSVTKMENLSADDKGFFSAFYCPSRRASRSGKQCDYAMNPYCNPDSPPDTVLLFETEEGWNKFGGPESMSFLHKIPTILPFRWEKGCNVLFNDGHIEFINSKKIGMLRWKDERAK